MNLNAPQVSSYRSYFSLFTAAVAHCDTILFTEYVETCQPAYGGGDVLLATYSEGESLKTGSDCQTIPVNNCRNVAKPNCRKIADEQCRKVPNRECGRVPVKECRQVSRR